MSIGPQLPLDNTFGISFDTDAVKATGIIKFVKVTICEDTLDSDDSVFVNLCEHPLYPKLEQYVKSNLSKRRKF
jgi:hypothetical protein